MPAGRKEEKKNETKRQVKIAASGGIASLLGWQRRTDRILRDDPKTFRPSVG